MSYETAGITKDFKNSMITFSAPENSGLLKKTYNDIIRHVAQDILARASRSDLDKANLGIYDGGGKELSLLGSVRLNLVRHDEYDLAKDDSFVEKTLKDSVMLADLAQIDSSREILEETSRQNINEIKMHADHSRLGGDPRKLMHMDYSHS